MGLVHSRGLGQYRASEVHLAIMDRMYKPNGTRRGIISIHGAGGNADSATSPTNLALAAAGYPVISCDFSSTYNWGNDDFIASMTAAWTYLKSPFGAKTDKVGLYCTSMGTGGLNWARQNLSSVFAAAVLLPLLDLDDVYQNDKGSFRASIGTAYGVTYPTALPGLSTHSPVAYGGSDLAALPVGMWASSDDNIASTTASANSWGGAGATKSVVDLGAVLHNGGSIVPQQVVQFFDDAGGRT